MALPMTFTTASTALYFIFLCSIFSNIFLISFG
eukprot:COSAG01_NODE_461_length_16698_cov_113.458160_7_plen_33_part_00